MKTAKQIKILTLCVQDFESFAQKVGDVRLIAKLGALQEHFSLFLKAFTELNEGIANLVYADEVLSPIKSRVASEGKPPSDGDMLKIESYLRLQASLIRTSDKLDNTSQAFTQHLVELSSKIPDKLLEGMEVNEIITLMVQSQLALVKSMGKGQKGEKTQAKDDAFTLHPENSNFSNATH